MRTTFAGIRREFERYRNLGERALSRMDDATFFRDPGPDTNSAAVLVKHLAGNLRSRWTDFLTTDGEKPDRNRDSEFVLTDEDTREELMRRWSLGWELVLGELARLTDADLERPVQVRGQTVGAGPAAVRQLGHAAYHVGQLVLLAREQSETWESLTIPRGGSAAYNERIRKEVTEG